MYISIGIGGFVLILLIVGNVTTVCILRKKLYKQIEAKLESDDYQVKVSWNGNIKIEDNEETIK